jgi:hypothetical protein
VIERRRRRRRRRVKVEKEVKWGQREGRREG